MTSRRQAHSTLLIVLFATAVYAGAGPFDARGWKVGYDASDLTQRITEYVLPSEAVESWSELVTRQVVFDPEHRVSPQALLDLIRTGFGADCKDLRWTVLENTQQQAVYEWSHSGCAEYPAQYEVSRLARCEAGLCRWAYSTKRVPVSEATRGQWRQIITKLVPGELP